ncbi:OmpH family outer membrane protein [Robiginitalea sp. IMCC44478]|uniref:OmpH family outer membrane protein n=1 Tax=Robiginitalea sp. IMCC44478 TaxID=3459122 RepID=UPI0040410E8B
MRNVLILIAVFILAGCQQDKIAFVDNVKLMDGYQRKIDVEAAYQQKSQVFAQKRDSISQAFQAEAQMMQSKSKGMSDQKAQEEYGNLQQRAQMIGQQLQQEEQRMQQQGQVQMDSVVSLVKEAIKSYGEQNGYTFILGGGDGGGVLYGAEAKDVTEEVLQLLNEGYKK